MRLIIFAKKVYTNINIETKLTEPEKSALASCEISVATLRYITCHIIKLTLSPRCVILFV